MSIGTIKSFSSLKSFGFIQPDDGSPDVFVHLRAIERSGMNELRDGQGVSYEVILDRRSGNAPHQSA